MITYRVYKLLELGRKNQESLMTICKEDIFTYDEFETMEKAIDSIKSRGRIYAQYTILPVIRCWDED